MKTSSFPKAKTGDFKFTEENLREAEKLVAKYPEGRQASAIISMFYLAQKQNDGWLPPEAIEYVAEYLDIAPIRAHEVATFYTMFNLKPVGTYFIQVCRTTPCWLRGSEYILKAALEKIGVSKVGDVSEDGLFSVVEVECLGACCNAPMVQINDWYYEDLTVESISRIIDELRAGKEVAIGSQTGRLTSAPEGERTTLKEGDDADA
ncbi:NADH-quinone oxidoreductase subunit NuoE [Kiloniella laminariae]|uniref:NADH-quinone oxidoreductase subunit NuoE n=1 Tax=Kiloniella laminariae TaxID=454162 RepID=A0ABT4LLN1_9PROT|nr:NADH-quinone oxidoreductase subunit NuoE [Kiloniella laminariae]MCZ4282002.1 NADH-quinone oxidoreductase subunit NuoE [Kiloniella laminariae]